MGSSIIRLNDDFLNQRRQQSLMDAMYRTSYQPIIMNEDLEDMYGITPLLLNQKRNMSYQDYLARPQISIPELPMNLPTPTPTPTPIPTPVEEIKMLPKSILAGNLTGRPPQRFFDEYGDNLLDFYDIQFSAGPVVYKLKESINNINKKE